MAKERNNGPWQKLKTFRPSKTLWCWSSFAVVVVTIATGFGWGGWVTGDEARDMAEAAAQRARARLVADVCVQRYVSGNRFADRLAELKQGGTFRREDMIADGDWTELPGVEEPVANAARLCANDLARMDAPGQIHGRPRADDRVMFPAISRGRRPPRPGSRTHNRPGLLCVNARLIYNLHA